VLVYVYFGKEQFSAVWDDAVSQSKAAETSKNPFNRCGGLNGFLRR
jgi:hypothetical protein